MMQLFLVLVVVMMLLTQSIAEDSYLHQSIEDILNNVKQSVSRATNKAELKVDVPDQLNYDSTASQPKSLIVNNYYLLSYFFFRLLF